eukprot:jgi/Tetstr1/421026/TSEL_012071.t1
MKVVARSSATTATQRAVWSAPAPGRSGTVQHVPTLGERRPALLRTHQALPCHLPGVAVASRPSRRARQAALRVSATIAESPGTSVSETNLAVGKYSVQVAVSSRDGKQHVHLETSAPSRMTLHWGLIGGKAYKGGWRLPEAAVRPANTIQYKDRALQTPFQMADGRQVLEITLEGDECSEELAFVFKDETGSWYDCNDGNFLVPLNPMEALTKATMTGKPAPAGPLPEIPNELGGIWAYIKWEQAGCPNRSQQESDAEYQVGLKELKMLLQEGVDMDTLWKVARGEIKYISFMESMGSEDFSMDESVATMTEAPPAEPEAPPGADLPTDLVNTQAYLIWIESGRPKGADFAQAARERLQARVDDGASVSELEVEVFEARKEQDAADRAASEEDRQRREEEDAQRRAEDEERRKQADAAAAKDAASKPAEPTAGDSVARMGSIELGAAFQHLQSRNVMDLIKPAEMPVLSAEKKEEKPSALEPLIQKAAVDESCKFRRVFPLGNQSGLLVVVRQADGDSEVTVDLTTDAADKLVLHWGVSEVERRHDWIQPSEDLLPEGSTNIKNGIAAETPFLNCEDDECDVEIGGTTVPLQRVRVTLPPNHGLISLQFVLRADDSTRWWKDGNSNFNIRVPGSGAMMVESIEEDFVDNPVGLEIIKAESSSMWTLMHRYNKCADLLEGMLNGQWGEKVDPADAAAHIYVCLRYSSNRHITWQRNYNTQPRILSAAQDRLTGTIAKAHANTTGETQEWVRLMMGMLGRGGDGQKIRDEILNIMHRHNIKEVKGTWMEQWHQKLHNNTTPDDVGICEAYLAFLRGNGDNGAYWRVLSDHGITRERLASFERNITCEPEDFPDRRDALIGEFENYLSILKAVHSGTDLMTSVQAASHSTPESAKGYLGYVVSNLRGQVVPLLEAAVEARTEIRNATQGNRELLYLDLALEGVIRGAAERAAGANPQSAIRLVGPLLQNLALTTGDNEEVVYCLAAWLALPEALRNGSYPGREEALQAAAVVDRIRICLANISDSVSNRIEPISSSLGHAFGVEEWAIELFAEEVVRGGPAFAVSQVLGNIEAGLRSAADLSAWQVISPGGAVGRVRVEHDLYEIQDDIYDEPTVLVIDRVTGEEEIPEGAVAVLTPDAPDVLSHVSVRARNMGVLFATCHDDEPLRALRELKGKVIDIKTSAAGDVVWDDAQESDLLDDSMAEDANKHTNLKIDVPKWVGTYAVGMDAFKTGVVGAKSKNIANLRGKLPDWVKLPASVTIPFGSFETALDEPECKEVKAALAAEVAKIKDNPAQQLRKCREIIMDMTVPEPLKAQLSAEMSAAGMKWPNGEERWDEAFAALKGVWASKFNERAYYSMRKAGLAFMDLRMAVLVMRVVPAQYAFVIHTVNPATRDEDEIYCELVKGLGETLVSGQFPGKSMAFSAKKKDLDNPRVLSYPSKSAAMFVPDSLIFRSDSNGEDLDGYAGAGLYDSITMDPCVTERVDYTCDPLIQDEEFRNRILSQICKVGLAIEEALGSAQDVEGVVDPDGNITVVQTRPQV